MEGIGKKFSKHIKDTLNYEFRDETLALISIIHSSIKNEYPDLIYSDNERLEFLGDAVLDLIVSRFLYEIPEHCKNEGVLTVGRAKIVNQNSLYLFAKDLKIDEFLIASKSSYNTDIRSNESVLSDAFEALLGAIFLDSGYNICEKIVIDKYEDKFIEILSESSKNYKSILSEFLDKSELGLAEYKLTNATGPDHNKTFESVVIVNGVNYGPGKGKTKRESEANAARIALESLNHE